MSSEDLPEEENGYSLKGSTSLVGQLYPVLKAKDGEILDGFHRSEADRSWRSEVLENIDSEEKKLVARLIANFHRRWIPGEEKATWINGLAVLYKEQGFRVFRDGDKSQGVNEIADRIAEVTGLSRRTVNAYLEDGFKQSNKIRKNHENAKRSKASEILFNALAGRSTSWAHEALERYQEELLKSPIFRARVFAMLPNHHGSGIPEDELPQLPPGVVRNRQGFFVYKKEHGHKNSGRKLSNIVSIEMSDYYKIFIEECPQCICAICPHAETCIERVRSDE